MKKIIKLSVVFVLLIIASTAYSQIGVTYYSSNIVAVNTCRDNKISVELKMFTNNNIEDLPVELDVFYNLKSYEHHKFSVGAGLKLEPLSGENAAVTIPFLLEVYPLTEFKKLSLLFELAPEIYFEDQVKLRSLIGLRYTFGK